MKVIKIQFLILLINLFIYSTGHSWEVYDKIIATVNETPVIESEFQQKFDRILKQQKIAPKKISSEKSRLLDKFIAEAIVEQTSKDQSIIVSPEKVDNQIKKIMQGMKFTSIESFKKEVEKTEMITFEEYKEEIRKSLVADQVMSIAIGVAPPSLKDAEEWYKGNKEKIGFEVNLQHIMINLKNDSFEENKRANKLATDLLNKIKNGQPFENIAREFSEDTGTKNSGGSMGWVPLSNMAKRDIILVNNIYNSFIINKNTYAVIKSSTAYHLVKYNGKRPTSFEAVKEEIFNLLYHKRVTEQFNKWVSQKKMESDIRIYMPDYIKEQASG